VGAVLSLQAYWKTYSIRRWCVIIALVGGCAGGMVLRGRSLHAAFQPAAFVVCLWANMNDDADPLPRGLTKFGRALVVKAPFIRSWLLSHVLRVFPIPFRAVFCYITFRRCSRIGRSVVGRSPVSLIGILKPQVRVSLVTSADTIWAVLILQKC